MVEEVPVVIVGGGPIGLTISCILGRNNIQHVLLEKNDTTSVWPKSMLTNTRSMELFHRLGLDGVLREEELPADNRIVITRSLMNIKPLLQFSPTQMIGSNPRKSSDEMYTFDEKWTAENILRLSQIYIEPILKKAASGYDSSEVKFGWKVEAISQSQDKVMVEAVSNKTGETKVYSAQYAIGCDGGRSFVRKSLGIHFKGEFGVIDMKTISYKSPELMGKLEMLDHIFGAITVKTDLLAGTLPLNNKGLFVSHFFRGFDKETRPEDLLKKLFDNEALSCKVVFSNDWQGHFAFAETMQKDRIFLAGDACHMMVPVGGFGMNTGVLDAFDLGWKLVATLKGWGGERLLASYTGERLPCIRKVLHRVRRLFFILQNYVGILAFLISTRPFCYVMRRFFDGSDIDAGISGILFGLRLDASPLCIPDSTPLPPEDPLNYTPIAYPGCRAPYYQFEDGSSLCDKLGSAFTLLHLKPSNQSCEPLKSAAGHHGIPLKVLSFEDDKLKTLYREMDFVLIRPDLYIAWCGNEIPTLSHNDDVDEGASVLMKVVTGAKRLPLEWQRRKISSNVPTVWRLPLLVSLLVGAIAISAVLLSKYNII